MVDEEVKSLFIRLDNLKKRYMYLSTNTPRNNRGINNSMIKEQKFLEGKYKHTIREIREKIFGNVICVTYEDINGNISNECFSISDSNLASQLIYLLYGPDIKILESKVYTTKQLSSLLLGKNNKTN